MSGVDFFIFILTMIMLTIIFMRRAAKERARRAQPDDEENEERSAEDIFYDDLKAMDLEIAHEKEPPHSRPPPPPPKPRVKKQAPVIHPTTTSTHKFPQTPFSHIPRMEKKQMGVFKKMDPKVAKQKIPARLEEVTHVEKMKGDQKRAYAKKQIQYSRATQILRSLKSSSDMMILHELFLPPKGFRPHN